MIMCEILMSGKLYVTFISEKLPTVGQLLERVDNMLKLMYPDELDNEGISIASIFNIFYIFKKIGQYEQ